MPLRRRRRRYVPIADPEATQPLQQQQVVHEEVYSETVPAEAPRPVIWPWLALLAVLLAAGIGVLVGLYYSSGDDTPATALPPPTTSTPSSVDVPDVVGQPADQAAGRLVDAGLKATFRRKLSKQPSGDVLEQDPAAASTVARGSTVVLTISRGVDTVAVPALTGLPVAEAIKTLTAAGLSAKTKNVASKKPPGQVIAQIPGGGRELRKGAAVQLSVSKRQPAVPVPDVVGQSQTAATVSLDQAGFQPAVRHVPADEPKGTVVAQSPAAGERAQKGSKVQINVSDGRAQGSTTTTKTTTTAGRVTVPDVVGLKQSAAQNVLAKAGLKADPKQVPSSEPVGNVLAQYPAAGSTAKRGGSIRINVSQGDGKADVPSVVGLAEKTAKSRLQEAGFKVAVVEQNTNDAAEDGVVVDQAPASGRLKPGNQVTIYVGVFSG